MGLVEHEAGEGADDRPDGVDLRRRAAVGQGAAVEFPLHLGNQPAVLLVERAAEDVGPAHVHAGEFDGDLQDVLLEDHEAVGFLQYRHEQGVGVCRRLVALMPPAEDLLFALIGRSRPDHRDDRREAVDVAAVALHEQAGHRGRFDVVHAAGLAAGDHVPRLALAVIDVAFEIDVDALGAFHLGHRVAQHRQARLAEQVDLDEAQLLDRVHVVLGDERPLGRALHGYQAAERLGRDHDPARVHGPVAREALDLTGGAQDRAVRLLVHGNVAGLGQVPDRFAERGGGRAREDFGGSVHFVSGQAVRLAQLGQGRTAVERVGRADHGHAVAAPALVHPADDLVALVPGQVEVDVGHLAEFRPLGVDEAVEGQVEAERAGLADAQGVADERIGRRAAGERCDGLAVAVFEDLVKDQEVFGILHLLDDAEFALEAGHHVVPARARTADALVLRPFDVAFAAAGQADLAQVGDGGPAVGTLERGEAVLRQVEPHIALLGDFERVLQGLRPTGEQMLHLARRPQVPEALRLVGMRAVDERERADRGEGPQHRVVVSQEAAGLGRGHNRNAQFVGDLRAFAGGGHVLRGVDGELDVEAVGEDIAKRGEQAWESEKVRR